MSAIIFYVNFYYVNIFGLALFNNSYIFILNFVINPQYLYIYRKKEGINKKSGKKKWGYQENAPKGSKKQGEEKKP